jgi:hypothetical protein
VLVVVLAMSCVAASVVHVVDVIPVRDGDVAASLTVHMVVRLVHRVAIRLTFVVVVVMTPVQVTIVDVVDMVPVRNRDVTASFAVRMIMCDVLVVDCARHGLTACS